MPTYSRRRRGFTLIEVMTAVVIVIILAALAVSYMIYGMGKARMNNAVFDATAMINGAQLRAISRGNPHYVLIYQVPSLGNRVRLQVLERTATTDLLWNALDLSGGTEAALNAKIRDEMVLGDGAGVSNSGVAFLDLDSSRVTKPLPPPFSAIPLTSPSFTASPLNTPSTNLMAGCNFCVTPTTIPYGLLRFNADGTMEVLTGNAPTGAVIAFAPSTSSEQNFLPKLLTVSAPAGATVVF